MHGMISRMIRMFGMIIDVYCRDNDNDGEI